MDVERTLITRLLDISEAKFYLVRVFTTHLSFSSDHGSHRPVTSFPEARLLIGKGKKCKRVSENFISSRGAGGAGGGSVKKKKT